MPPPLAVAFAGGDVGGWRVTRVDAVAGATLPAVARVEMLEGEGASAGVGAGSAWVLRGVTSNLRYTTRAEHAALAARQPALGRADATSAALIPITKSEAWWALGQDERRRVLEESSHHVAVGLEYLPVVARRLHHGRDLGQPFDFLTWFEYPPEATAAFEDLVQRLRATPEWDYVEREVDIRLVR